MILGDLQQGFEGLGIFAVDQVEIVALDVEWVGIGNGCQHVGAFVGRHEFRLQIHGPHAGERGSEQQESHHVLPRVRTGAAGARRRLERGSRRGRAAGDRTGDHGPARQAAILLVFQRAYVKRAALGMWQACHRSFLLRRARANRRRGGSFIAPFPA
jgi:hypothetical protein